MVRVGLVIQRLWVRISGPAGIVGGGVNNLSPPSIPRLRCPWARLRTPNCSPGAVTCPLLRVCVHLGWVKCREYISLLVIYSLYNRVCDKYKSLSLSHKKFSVFSYFCVFPIHFQWQSFFFHFFLQPFSFFESSPWFFFLWSHSNCHKSHQVSYHSEFFFFFFGLNFFFPDRTAPGS